MSSSDGVTFAQRVVSHRLAWLGPAARAIRVLRVGLQYLLLAIGAFVSILPYLLALSTSLKTEAQVGSQPPWALPSPLTFSAYTQLFAQQDFARYVLNTLLVASVGTTCQITVSLLAGYALAVLPVPGKRVIFPVMVGTLMVPGIVTIIPLFLLVRDIGLLNTRVALFLPFALGSPLAIFFLRQSFLSVPHDLRLAAQLDGASEVRVLRSIYLPSAAPAVMTMMLLSFIGLWNNFLWPLVAVNSDSSYVMTVAIANLNTTFGTQWDLMMAAAMVSLAPLVVLFLTNQKRIVRNLAIAGRAARAL